MPQKKVLFEGRRVHSEIQEIQQRAGESGTSTEQMAERERRGNEALERYA